MSHLAIQDFKNGGDAKAPPLAIPIASSLLMSIGFAIDAGTGKRIVIKRRYPDKPMHPCGAPNTRSTLRTKQLFQILLTTKIDILRYEK